MRDIRFRAWDKKKNDWFDEYDGELYIELNGNINFGWNGEVMDDYTDRVILLQYTGLKDSNGVEIYEGDILKCTSRIYTNLGATGTGEYEENIKQVIWKDDSWGTRIISSNLTSKGAEKSGLVISAKYAEIIGNIYENPELLEG